jgi:hypothetical protein
MTAEAPIITPTLDSSIFLVKEDAGLLVKVISANI